MFTKNPSRSWKIYVHLMDSNAAYGTYCTNALKNLYTHLFAKQLIFSSLNMMDHHVDLDSPMQMEYQADEFFHSLVPTQQLMPDRREDQLVTLLTTSVNF
ncbi:unnamed protein product [Musa textilis]